MKIGINCGHTVSGPGSGAVGYLNESNESRKIGKALISKFRANGHTVVDCTIDKASSRNAYLSKAVNLANDQSLDYFISIHLNAGGGKGVEAYTYKGRQFADALEVCQNISALGFKNRGVKNGTGLYVIHKTKAKSILIEVCFVDTASDANIYNKVGPNAVVDAIYNAIADVSTGTVSAGTNAIQSVNNNKTNSTKEIIRAGQQHSINFTEHKIDTDGIRGSDTKRNGVRCVQVACNMDYKGEKLVVDGLFGTKSKNKFGKHYVKKGETQYLVTALEILLMLNGYDAGGVECPGIFGSKLEAAVLQYQKDHGLKPDAVAGVNTFKSLMGV